MFAGITLAYSELSLELMEQYELEQRMHERGGEREIQFLFREQPRCLPVWFEGQLQIVSWGNHREQSQKLPCTGWTWQATVEAGGWNWCQPEAVDVPATMGLDNGVWYRIRQGIRAILVRDENNVSHVYLICEPASHYYEIMTRSSWMPLLIDERI